MTIVPAIFGGVVIALVASAQLVKPGEHEAAEVARARSATASATPAG